MRELRTSTPGVIVRPADAEVIPPLSDYDPFWRAQIPFLFLTSGRSRVYHTVDDTPDKLDLPKIAATATWLTNLVRALRIRPTPIRWDPRASADAATLDELTDLVTTLAAVSTEATHALPQLAALRRSCDRTGRLPDHQRHLLGTLVGALESRLA